VAGAQVGHEYLYWYEDGPARYLVWSATKHDYPVEWQIQDGNEVGSANGEALFDTSLAVRSGVILAEEDLAGWQ
jgi:hypothetical protein